MGAGSRLDLARHARDGVGLGDDRAAGVPVLGATPVVGIGFEDGVDPGPPHGVGGLTGVQGRADPSPGLVDRLGQVVDLGGEVDRLRRHRTRRVAPQPVLAGCTTPEGRGLEAERDADLVAGLARQIEFSGQVPVCLGGGIERVVEDDVGHGGASG